MSRETARENRAILLVDSDGTLTNIDHTDGRLNVKLVDSLGNDVEVVNGELKVSTKPYNWNIAEGNIANHTVVRRHGYNIDIDTDWETVSEVGDIRPLLSSAEILKVSSTSDDDVSDGDGARTMKISGLDDNYEVISDTITLTGTSAVSTNKAFLRILKAEVLTAGVDGANVGKISINNNADDTTLEVILAEENFGKSAAMTVPAGQEFHLVEWWGAEASNKGVRWGIWIKTFGGLWKLYKHRITFGYNFFDTLQFPLIFSEKTDVEIRAKALQVDAVGTGGFNGYRQDV